MGLVTGVIIHAAVTRLLRRAEERELTAQWHVIAVHVVAEFILIGDKSVVNTALRFPEELARHKALDAIGDLYLIGRPLRARIDAVMTGHSDNVDILKAIWKAVEAG